MVLSSLRQQIVIHRGSMRSDVQSTPSNFYALQRRAMPGRRLVWRIDRGVPEESHPVLAWRLLNHDGDSHTVLHVEGLRLESVWDCTMADCAMMPK